MPLVFLQNITGFMVGRRYENEGIARHGAKLVTAVSTASVAEVHRGRRRKLRGGQLRDVRGAPSGPRFLWMWPNARTSVMGGEQAANVLLTVRMEALARKGETMTEAERAEFKAPTLAKYAEESAATYSTARLWDDGIIAPEDTRRVLSLAVALAMAAPQEEPGFSLYRM